ncbi:hypothetical protein D3C87_1749540 [compost metagenome]
MQIPQAQPHEIQDVVSKSKFNLRRAFRPLLLRTVEQQSAQHQMQQQPAAIVKMEQDMLGTALHKDNPCSKERLGEFLGLHIDGFLTVYGYARNWNIYKMLAEQLSVILHFRQFRHIGIFPSKVS